MTDADLAILKNTLPGNETPPDFAIKLLEDTCERSGLDWKMRHVYLMKRGGKWGVTLSIDGFRLISSQDQDYGGQEGPFWVTSVNGTWSDIPPDGPIYAAKVGVKHKSGGVTWGVAKFKDYSAGPMWTKFPSTMSAKCAEMLALRKAMPGRLGGLYGVEEMEQAGFKVKPATPEPMTVDQDTVKNSYLVRLNAVQDKPTLLALGDEIKGDKTLTLEVITALHRVYTERKDAVS